MWQGLSLHDKCWRSPSISNNLYLENLEWYDSKFSWEKAKTTSWAKGHRSHSSYFLTFCLPFVSPVLCLGTLYLIIIRVENIHPPVIHSFIYQTHRKKIYKFIEWLFKVLNDPIKQKGNWDRETNIEINYHIGECIRSITRVNWENSFGQQKRRWEISMQHIILKVKCSLSIS